MSKVTPLARAEAGCQNQRVKPLKLLLPPRRSGGDTEQSHMT